jgi:peptide/nickel transport system substrate-binding protein
MKRRHLLVVAGVVLVAALVAAGCGGSSSSNSQGTTTQAATRAPAASNGGAPKAGGTLIFGAEQEPPCMNPFLNDCNNTWQLYFTQLVLRSAFVVNPKFQYVPDLVTGATLQMNPERVTYHIKKQAKWNDGTPVTGKDFVFTYRTIMNKAWDKKPTGGGIISRIGYDHIVKSQIGDGGKSVTFTFKPSFADWKDLFSTILPQHALQGTDLTKDFINAFTNPKTGKPISDGPFVFGNWAHGSQFSLVRNPAWWGPHKSYLSKIVARFLTDSNTEIQQLRGGEVDAIYPQPQLPLAQLRTQKGVTVESNLGPNWEHIDINTDPKKSPLLAKPWVRQALMLSIDRKSMVDSLLGKLSSGLKPLDNLVYLNNNPNYKPDFAVWNYDPKKAQQILQSHGCSKAGGVWTCGGKKLAFQFESTTGNQLRTLAFEIIQQQLKANGIQVTNNFKPSTVFFGSDLTNRNYQLGMYAWSAPSPDPTQTTPIYFCPNDGGGQNFTGYCNKQVDALFKKGNAELNQAKRAQYYNQADRIMAQSVPTIPLYQKPTFLAFQNYVHNMHDNVLAFGPMWNAQDWYISR